MKGIYEFYWDCHRSGSLDGIFVADSDDVAEIIGKEIYFGEVLGKHSEVYGTLDAGDIKLKTVDQAFIEQFEAIMGENFVSGFSPLEYYDPDYGSNSDEDEDEE